MNLPMSLPFRLQLLEQPGLGMPADFQSSRDCVCASSHSRVAAEESAKFALDQIPRFRFQVFSSPLAPPLRNESRCPAIGAGNRFSRNRLPLAPPFAHSSWLIPVFCTTALINSSIGPQLELSPSRNK